MTRRLLGGVIGLLAGVPAALAGAPQIAFVDAAPTLGLSHIVDSGVAFPALFGSLFQTNMGYGGAVGDYDNDGDLDIFLVGGSGSPNRMFRNDLDLGSAGFTDVSATVGSALVAPGLVRFGHFVDLDNDDFLDLLLIGDHDPPDGAISTSRVLRNMGDGTFVDMTAVSGFETTGYIRAGASLADADHDGLLDVYVSAWVLEVGLGSPEYTHDGLAFYNRFFRNTGGFTFSDDTFAAGFGFLARDSFTSVFADFDHNLDPDVFVAIDHSSDAFFSNNGGLFTDVTLTVGTVHTGNDMGAACADFDDDGDLDLFTTNITDDTLNPCGAGTTQGNALYVNQLTETGSLTFTDEASSRGVFDTAWGWGTGWIDYENDGHLDLVACTGFDQWLAVAVGTTCGLYQTPTYSFQNDGGGQFARIAGIGMDASDDSRGLCVFDFDRDGDQDVLIINVDQPVRLFENQTQSPGHWLGVEVRQRTGMNRMGIGVRIDALVDGVWKRRDILAGQSYVCGHPPEVHFGLGTQTHAEALRVRWTDGTVTTLADVPANQLVRIDQPICPCDWDRSESIAILDLLAFLSDWYGDGLAADLNGDNAVDVSDLLAFLACWFPGC